MAGQVEPDRRQRRGKTVSRVGEGGGSGGLPARSRH